MIALIAFGVFLVFIRSIRGEFLFDDPAILDMEQDFKAGTWSTIAGFKDSPRSLTHLIYSWTWKLFGFHPAAWHGLNLLLHAGCVLLAYVLLFDPAGPRAALIAAAIFAYHPLQTSAVCYISGRSAIQSTFFTLCGLAHFQFGGWHLPLAVISQYFAWKSKQDALIYLALYPMLWFFWLRT